MSLERQLRAMRAIGGFSGGSRLARPWSETGVADVRPPQEYAFTWTQLADLPTARAYARAHGPFVFCGRTQAAFQTVTEIYDPDTDTWSAGDDPPGNTGVGPAVEVDGVIYLLGPSTGSPTGLVWAYTVGTDTWATRTSAPTGYQVWAAAAIDGLIYTVDPGSDAMKVYDPSGDSWSDLTATPPVFSSRAASLNGRMWMISDNAFAESLVLHSYDPGTDGWTEHASMPVGREDTALVAAHGRLHVLGGWKLAENEIDYLPSDDHWSYDPASDSWTHEPTMPFSVAGAVASTVDGGVHLFGGSSTYPSLTALDAHWVYASEGSTG